MFEFLKSKKNRFLGVDFGTSSIKVVELLYKDQKVSLENYGIADLDWFNNLKQQSDLKDLPYEQKLNSALKKLLEKMHLTSGMAYVSIPGFSGLITILDLLDMPDEELAKAIKFEAQKYIPSSLDEVVMSWEVIEHINNNNLPLGQAAGNSEGNKMRVLLVAAPKKDIEHYNRLVSDTKLKVEAVELETFSIVRSLVGDDSNGIFLIIDIGARATNIILVEKGTVLVNRNIDAGGNEITTAISDSMSISKQRAENFKKGEKDLLNSKESYLVIPILEFITSESKRILNAYKLKNRDVRIDGVLLSGGTSKMKGLEEYFTSSLGTTVTLGNPWRKIAAEGENALLIKNLGTSFSVAIGLALRGVEEYRREQ